jgi:hypothetical protein
MKYNTNQKSKSNGIKSTQLYKNKNSELSSRKSKEGQERRSSQVDQGKKCTDVGITWTQVDDADIKVEYGVKSLNIKFNF